MQPIKSALDAACCGRASTPSVIDGAVNGAGDVRGRRAAPVLRRLQTGSVRAYAASLFLGVVAVLGYYLWQYRSGAAERMTSRCSRSIIALPLVGALLLLFIGNRDGSRDGADPAASRSASRWCVFARDAAALGAASTPRPPSFQFVERAPWIPAFGIDYYVGVDGISLLLVVLTGFLTPLALLSSWESIEKKVKEFSIFMLLLEAAMIGVFVSLDLFLFYVFWDAMLIPMYFLIGIWGYDRASTPRSSSCSTRWPAAS